MTKTIQCPIPDAVFNEYTTDSLKKDILYNVKNDARPKFAAWIIFTMMSEGKLAKGDHTFASDIMTAWFEKGKWSHRMAFFGCKMAASYLSHVTPMLNRHVIVPGEKTRTMLRKAS